jgi:AAA domain
MTPATEPLLLDWTAPDVGLPPAAPRPTPQTTIDTVMWTVREYGLKALKEPATQERLRRCDATARAQISARIEKLLAAGKLTMLAGDASLGKSTLSTDIARRVSTGKAWPDGGRAACDSIVILSAEDGLADTLRPRLDAAGADAWRIHVMTALIGEDGVRRGGAAPGDRPVSGIPSRACRTDSVSAPRGPDQGACGGAPAHARPSRAGECGSRPAWFGAIGERPGCVVVTQRPCSWRGRRHDRKCRSRDDPDAMKRLRDA